MKTILVPTDFNELATAALRYAAQIAAATGAEIVVLYADRFDPPAEFTAAQAQLLAGSIAESRRRADEELAMYTREIVPDSVAVRTVIREDFPATAIRELADEVDADLIVMGTHGRGLLTRILFGSVAEAVLRDTRRPVLTVRSTKANDIRTIACTDDGASPFAASLAGQLGAELVNDRAGADLVVTCERDTALVRQSPVPVLTVR
jgi:nucleotide-binding universal stress UspA family protein